MKHSVLLLLLAVWLVITIFNFIVFLDEVFPKPIDILRDNYYLVSPGLTLILILTILICYLKEERAFELLTKWVLFLYSSSLICVIFALLFGNSKFWFLKYIIGFVIGGIACTLKLKNYDKHALLFVGLIAFGEIIMVESIEYFVVLDPPNTPSLLYINSFPNPMIWGLFILIVIIPAYFLASRCR